MKLASVRVDTFFGKPLLMVSVANLLISHGPDLRFAFLGDMRAELCRHVVGACRNAQFTVRNSPNSLQQLVCLDGRVCDLEVSDTGSQIAAEVSLTRGALGLLRKLDLNCEACGDEVLHVVLSNEMGNLRAARLLYFSYVSTRTL